MNQLLNIRKVNIGIEENPKFASIGDYWDEETMEKTTDLLHEFQDLFPTKFYEMKWILGDLGQMKIPLKTDAKLVRQRPYRLNPRYKEKVKDELDRMLDAGIIEPVEESKWVGPMVVQGKKTGEVQICVDLRKLNDACMHDPSPTPFTDEVLEGVGDQEMYSFTDGFSGYHHIRITKEYRHKMTFVTKWGCFQYTVIPFGLKNVPRIFSRVVVAAFK